eukprot:3282012-Rhodomonas_salina.1
MSGAVAGSRPHMARELACQGVEGLGCRWCMRENVEGGPGGGESIMVGLRMCFPVQSKTMFAASESNAFGSGESFCCSITTSRDLSQTVTVAA